MPECVYQEDNKMSQIGAWFAPILICIIVLSGVVRTDNCFDTFIIGAKSGLKTVYSIAPSLIGLITAVEMMKVSGAIDILNNALEPVSSLLHIPKEVMPLVILRPITGSGSLAMLDRLLSSCGANSIASRTACVMCASSETTFYTTALYFSSVKVRRIRYTLVAALAADFICVLVSCVTVGLFFE